MPIIDDTFGCLKGTEYLSSFDIFFGYWQIPMHESQEEKTVLFTSDDLYEFNVIPFGLRNAPATFEWLLDTVLRGLKWKTYLYYLNDDLILSSTTPSASGCKAYMP